MRENVRCEQALRDRYDAGALTLTDDAMLALANAIAGIFPDIPVYATPIRQGIGSGLPAWFVRFYEVASARLLDDVEAYEYGFDLAYFPKNPESDFELNDATHMVLQNLFTFPGQTGDFSIYRKGTSVTDRVLHVTGTFSAMEQTVSDAPLINIAEKEVNI